MMNRFISGPERPIPRKNNFKYKGIGYDGCYFYLTSPDCNKIYKFDKCFCEIGSFDTCKAYTSICFDPDEECFWASTEKDCNKLFKLDMCFREIDCLTVYLCKGCRWPVTGISYDCSRKRLVVAFASCVVSANKTDKNDCEIITKSCGTWNMGVLSISPSYIITEMSECKQYISIYNCDRTQKCKFEVPKDIIVEAIIFVPCAEDCDKKYHFYLLATKNGCYSYLLNGELDCHEIDICLCNYEIYNRNCSESPCPEPYCRQQACTDILESIALIETALSHILNAEGEKMQKFIASTDDLDKILSANKAINETIVNVTHLEIILHGKLADIKGICGDCTMNCPCDKECPCDNNRTCDCDKECSWDDDRTCDCDIDDRMF